MDQKNSSPTWTILGIGIMVAVGFGLLLVFLGGGSGVVAPTPISTIPTPSAEPIAASVNGRPIEYSFWMEAVLLDQVMSELTRQPSPTPEETLQRLINEELVLRAISPEQAPTAEQTEEWIARLEQAWGVDDAAVVTALGRAGLTRATLEQTVWRLLTVQANLETLRKQGYDTAAWLEEQRASAEIVLNEIPGGMAVPHIPVAQSPLAAPTMPPTTPSPSPGEQVASPTPTSAPPTEPFSPTPTLASPAMAPDFTLEQAGGGALTLSEQLDQGPVVMVFFQKCG